VTTSSAARRSPRQGVRARELEQNALAQLAAARAQTAERARERNRAAIQCIEQESSSAVAALEQVPAEKIRIIAQAIVRQLVEGEQPP
jgi:hypothetical protein